MQHLIAGLLIQLPLFALLYRAIGTTLVSTTRFLWIRSLALPDSVVTLPVVGLTWLAAYLMPSGSAASRSTVMTLQIAITFFIVWKFAAGYSLYWISSAAVGAAQSLWLRSTSRQ